MNWVQVDEKTAEWLLQQCKEDNMIHSSNSLHCWDEIFTVGGCRFKVEGSFSSDKVSVYKERTMTKLDPPVPPPMREYRGLVRVNEYKTVDWYTERGILYPDVLISTRFPTTWFGRLFMSEDQKMLERSLTRNRMMCTEWPRC